MKFNIKVIFVSPSPFLPSFPFISFHHTIVTEILLVYFLYSLISRLNNKLNNRFIKNINLFDTQFLITFLFYHQCPFIPNIYFPHDYSPSSFFFGLFCLPEFLSCPSSPPLLLALMHTRFIFQDYLNLINNWSGLQEAQFRLNQQESTSKNGSFTINCQQYPA